MVRARNERNNALNAYEALKKSVVEERRKQEQALDEAWEEHQKQITGYREARDQVDQV